MNKRASAFCFFLLLLSTLTFQNLAIVRSTGGEEETEYYVKSMATYSNNGDSIWNFTEREEHRTVGLFMNNSWQTVCLVNSTPSIEAGKSDNDGNKVAILQFPEALESGEEISYTVTYHVVSRPRILDTINEADSKSLNEIPESLKEKYLGKKGPWLVNDTELQNLAHDIAGTETRILTIVKNLVDWIAKNIAYKSHEVPQYPNETLLERGGDCDDQAILFITLCRIIGIPAFLQIGAIYNPFYLTDKSYWEDHVKVVQRRISWHGWAMVYIPPWEWLPVDLTYVFSTITYDPLNAIRNAAVTSQNTIQYANISQTPYVSSSRDSKDFLITNNFTVFTEDEMIKVTDQENLFGGNMEWLFPVVLVAVVFLLIAGSYILSRRLKREEEIPTPC